MSQEQNVDSSLLNPESEPTLSSPFAEHEPGVAEEPDRYAALQELESPFLQAFEPTYEEVRTAQLEREGPPASSGTTEQEDLHGLLEERESVTLEEEQPAESPEPEEPGTEREPEELAELESAEELEAEEPEVFPEATIDPEFEQAVEEATSLQESGLLPAGEVEVEEYGAFESTPTDLLETEADEADVEEMIRESLDEEADLLHEAALDLGNVIVSKAQDLLRGIDGDQYRLAEDPVMSKDEYDRLGKDRFSRHRGKNMSEGLSRLWKEAGYANLHGKPWCGAFIVVALKRAGVTDPDWLKLIGTIPARRLADKLNKQASEEKRPSPVLDLGPVRDDPAARNPRLSRPGVIAPGDVMVFPHHLVLVKSYDASTGRVTTLQGNTWDGDGISRAMERTYYIRTDVPDYRDTKRHRGKRIRFEKAALPPYFLRYQSTLAASAPSPTVSPPSAAGPPVSTRGAHKLRRVKRGGYAGHGGGRLDGWLRKLREMAKVAISDADIDTLQRIANVESGGHVHAINTWDSGVVSFGFKQLTLQHGRLQKLIAQVPEAFQRYGIELGGTYVFEGRSVAGIKGVPNKEDLRSAEWSERFFRAGMDPDIIVAVARTAQNDLAQLDKVVQTYAAQSPYVRSARVRALVAELQNNRPAYVKPVLQRVVARAASLPEMSQEKFMDLLVSEIVAEYEKHGRNGKTIEERRRKALRWTRKVLK